MHLQEGLDIGFCTENCGTVCSVLCFATYIETSLYEQVGKQQSKHSVVFCLIIIFATQTVVEVSI
jgi:hypothetical protein